MRCQGGKEAVWKRVLRRTGRWREWVLLKQILLANDRMKLNALHCDFSFKNLIK